jgi:tyrosinase
MADRFSRRRLLAGGISAVATGLIPFPEWLAYYGRADATPPLVRYSVNTPAGAAMLAKYRAAVDTMMQRGKGEPCGWTFQWYTHQIREDLQKGAEIAALPAGQQPLATDMWNTCQAHFGRPLDYFLPWHRMYVYFLERIVRQACGDPAFTLPYWDYIDPAQRALPQPFWSPAPNALLRLDRNGGVNAGQPIDQGQFPDALNLDCIKETDYLSFSAQINQNPHGKVHTLVGNLLGMGKVPWAANDPIFWLHHSNVDRLWASWNGWGRANPATASWRDHQFVFADENCNRVLVKVSDFEAIAPLGYAYDRLLPSFRLPPRFRDFRLIAVYRDPRPDPGPLRLGLGDRPVTVRLTAPNGPATQASGLRTLAAAQNVRLTVRDLQAAAAPGILYDFFLNLPQGASAAVARAHHIGSVTFFDAVVPNRAQMGEMSHADMAGGKGPSFSFDVTALVRQLGRIDHLDVTIAPHGRPAEGARPVIGNIELSAG